MQWALCRILLWPSAGPFYPYLSGFTATVTIIFSGGCDATLGNMGKEITPVVQRTDDMIKTRHNKTLCIFQGVQWYYMSAKYQLFCPQALIGHWCQWSSVVQQIGASVLFWCGCIISAMWFKWHDDLILAMVTALSIAKLWLDYEC